MLITFIFAYLFTSVAAFDLVKEYAGSTFFDDWEYFDFYDNLTFGKVNYASRDVAMQQKLTYITPQNTAIIRVDNFTNVPFGENRTSVRITSQDFYDIGSMWIFDAVHLPFGCSVWPAWWTKGPLWPDDGEIDIIENINLATNNQMALHTTKGCMQTSDPRQSGTVGSNHDCSPGSGCVIADIDKRSWGQPFADAGGGVLATQFDVSGIYMWFWSRADVPSNLAPSAPSDKLNISTWGPPTASWLGSTCNISEFFTAQQLVLNIDLCGDWAGVPDIYSSSCGAQPPNDPTNPISSKIPRQPDCYADNVVGPGERFNDAYFEINHIRAYTAALPSTTGSPGASQSSNTGGGSAPDLGTSPTQTPPAAGKGGKDEKSAAVSQQIQGLSLSISVLILLVNWYL
ncbi:glycoside hydrolase family 16 protein [Sphaerobolus stellatus SS14]|uniref:Glycoside hydrolase family 16 protein n=1 Tax=Sphaerobolus stellatus (strain SS14) TaxID=990650 RepID=A0A0C9UNQ8_SPHS4|nr:glycoside hydrolase family 16 protein [Sphaerobolus stellatus SS14]